MMFCAQRGCQVPPAHSGPLCPVCNNPLQDNANKQPAAPESAAQQPPAAPSRKKKSKPAKATTA